MALPPRAALGEEFLINWVNSDQGGNWDIRFGDNFSSGKSCRKLQYCMHCSLYAALLSLQFRKPGKS